MSAFDDFTDESLSSSGDIIGRESFTITGLPGSYAGIVNEFTAAREIDLGGKVGTYTATVVCELDQFDDLDGPLERTLEGKRITINGSSYKCDRAALDGSSLTLGLANLNQK
jgi:hypothetical protein